jgi:hypothetical protein
MCESLRAIVHNVHRDKEAPSQTRARRVLVLIPNTRKVTLRGQLDFIAVEPSEEKKKGSADPGLTETRNQ